MSIENFKFRSQVLGGFDRQDVINYIEKASAEMNLCIKERDELQKEKEELTKLVSRLEGRIALETTENISLKEFLEEERARSFQYREEKLREAEETVCTLLEECVKLREDMSLNITQAKCEIERIDSGISGLSGLFGEAEERLRNLSNEIKGMQGESETENTEEGPEE